MTAYVEELLEEWDEDFFDEPPESFEQGYDAVAKQSTRYLATGASVTACNTDRSQYLTNLSVGTDVVHESPTTRFNRSHPRTIGLRIEINNTDTGALWRHGTGGNLERIDLNVANAIRVTVNNSVVLTYTITGLGASREGMVVAWISEANPDTTGASDAVQSWLCVWNTTDGTFDKVRFTHAAKNLEATNAYWGATDSAGANSFAPGIITGVWYENRAQSTTEITNDWVAPFSAPLTTLDADEGHQGVPVLSSLPIGAQNHWHGPLAAMVCDATRRLYRRTLSPLWNERMRIADEWTQANLDATNNPFIRGAPDTNGYRCHLAWLRAYPVPDTASHLFVRVQLRSYPSSGAAVPLGVRLYSWNRPPGILQLQGQDGEAEPFTSYHATEVVTRDDTSTAGSYAINAVIPIARGTTGLHKGWTYLAIALNVDPANVSANDSNARVRVRASHGVPLFRQSQGGLVFGGGAGGFGG